MNIIIGKRGTGKTTELLKESAEKQIYILTATKHRARALFDSARDRGLIIPFPVTLEEYFQGSKFIGSSIRRDGLLIDDADDVLQQIFAEIPIRSIAMTDYRDNIKYLS